MHYKKQGLPEEGELIIGTVKKILPHSIFVNLDEYQGKEGMIHISEIAPGRIRNIRDFVREGKVIVCKTLRIHTDKDHIDLSLRRVSLSARKKKEEEYKQEQKAEKFIETVMAGEKIDIATFYKKYGESLLEKYGNLNSFFKAVLADGASAFTGIKIEKPLLDKLVEKIIEKIKPPEVVIEARLRLSSMEVDGVEKIKKSFEKTMLFAQNHHYKMSVSYLGAPYYRLNVFSDDFKKADKVLEEVLAYLTSFGEKEHVDMKWEKKY